jgi:predicted membrane protein
MNFLSSGVFWGVVIVLFGISIILKEILHVDIPVFRLLAGFIIIYVGVRMLVGWHGYNYRNAVVFSEARISAGNSNNEYKVIFGKGTVDLTADRVKEAHGTIKVDTIFGDCSLLVDQAVPMKIEINAAFAGAIMPDGNVISTGKVVYTTKAYKEGENFVYVKADVVFGSLKIVNP